MRSVIALLTIALIAGILGFSGLVGPAVYFAWILAVVAMIVFAVNMLTGGQIR